MLVRLLGRIAVVLAPMAVLFGLAVPAQAAGELTIQASFVCTIYPGQRSINFLVFSNLPETGTVTAFSVSPSTLTGYLSPVGAPIGGNATAYAQIGTGPGPDSASMSITVRYPTSGPDSGPLVVTETRTIQLNPCLPRPSATLRSLCNGSVEVTMNNGTWNDVTETGGYATFDIFAAYGYHAGPHVLQPWRGPAIDIVPASAAGSITVTGEGAVVAQGGYVAAPGCVGYVPGQPNPPAGSGSGGGGAGGAPSPGQEPTVGGSSAAAGTPPVTKTGSPSGVTGTAGRAGPESPAVPVIAIGLASGAVLGVAGAAVALLVSRRRGAGVGEVQP